MKKFLAFLDENILRFSIAFLILFIPLYPKLPSISISHVWVYIRLEDFLILLVTLIWFIQLVRRKVSLPKPEGYALAGYWIAGLVSLIYCLLFIASHLANFFPKIAALEYLRRIEYMILFFAAFSSIKKQKDVIFYLKTLGIALALITIYGFGQKFYTVLWSLFPAFFKQYQFCFPAFLTGNEEFAKGVPLCLNDLSRIASTFGGNYDLSSYLVMVIPIFIALFIKMKKVYVRVLVLLLVVFALEMLNFTSSRTAYLAYLVGVMGMLVIWKKKRWIVPVFIVSIGVLFLFSTTTLQRFEKTIQQVQIVQVNSGSSQQNQEIQNIIKKSQQNQANTQPQSPPPGTVTVGNEENGAFASTSGQVVTSAELQSLQEQNIDISTVSGSFLLKKAYALDVSLTTRFQAEWPRDWQAFLGSPLFGTGYSSLTLASDNDYLRALGETGLVGTLSFFFIFVMFGIFMKNVIGSVKDPITKALLFGLTGGVIGLLVNAILIDVFEASKVAESFWILLGISVGGAKLYQKEPIPYKKEIIHFFTSYTMIIVYLLLTVVATFISTITNFFVADDFVWLHWAATAMPSDLPKYFIQAQDFFYRPLDKVIVYFLYSVFSFQPQGFHIFILFVHFITVVGVFFLAQKLSRSRLVGALTALLFALHPAHSENIYWFSTISVDLGAMFIVYMMLAYMKFRENSSVTNYVLSVILAALAFISYEIAVVVPLLLMALDIFILKPKKNLKTLASYLPFILLVILYFIMRSVSHAFSGGGDYSYHLARIIPNTIGNVFGYTGIFLGGLPFLSFYNFLRGGLRADWIYFTVVALLIVGYLVWVISVKRTTIKKILWNENAQLILFCLVFAVISLLPFLPLGNIAPRYLYLASAGYAFALVLSLRLLFVSWLKTPRYTIIALIVTSVILSTIYFASDIQEQQQWQSSGNITKNTLLYFRKNYASFSPKTDLYFVNTPVQVNDTWVFPVGLQDGLWFIYRDNTPQVHQVGSVDDAQKMITTSGNKDTHIFRFDGQYNIRKVK
ncbi:MAG TPA: O-antigen ligase family protein [Candidatus Acidoferrales bacterium]|nr:O-antigen ligase family protein [Candidatus Acidoferrales bacterium]